MLVFDSFLPFRPRGTTFVTASIVSCILSSFLKGIYSKRTELAPMARLTREAILLGQSVHSPCSAHSEAICFLFFQPEVILRRTSIVMESLPKFVYDNTMDSKHRGRLIEKEMNDQAKIVQDLK